MSFLVVVVVLSAALSFAPTATSKSNYPIAKPNCDDRCGNVSIPFPFGLSPGCYLNIDFLITCNTTSYDPPQPFLRDSIIPVRRISVEGQLMIMKFIAQSCDEDHPFISSKVTLPKLYVNQTANKFVAVGCNTIATISGEENGKSYQTGCIASCNRFQDVVNGACNGIGCCQTTDIPMLASNAKLALQNMTTTDLQYRDGNVTDCSYAFVVKKDEFTFSSRMLTQEWEVNKRMPMVVDWVIFNDTCSNSSSTCHGNTTCVPFEGPDNGYRCACKKGFEGNPYLHPGCLDNDECADDGQNDCSAKNATCLNTLGGYNCTCKAGYFDDGKGVCQLPIKDECKHSSNGKGCHSSNRVVDFIVVGKLLFLFRNSSPDLIFPVW